MQKKHLLIPILAVLTLLFSCAHQTTPSGGPDDKTSPRVISSFPQQDAVNVPKKSHITIVFSEWISSKSDRGVSIFPATKLKVKVVSNRLEIIPVNGLADSTTYHITINTLLQDLHNNSIMQPLNLTFSTGNALDSGILSGCVIDPAKKELQPKIALFKKEHALLDSGFSVSPDFLFQTDSTGRFELSHIRSGIYHIIAYLDLNSDNRIQPINEQIYIPTDSLIIVNQKTKPVTFFPALYDTTRPILLTIKAKSSTLLSGQWNSSFESQAGFSLLQCTIERIDSLLPVISGTYIPLPDKRIFTLALKTPLRIAPYRLIYKTKKFTGDLHTDTITFNGINSADSLKPVFQSSIPASGSIPIKPSIKLVWSKPVIINTPLRLTDSLGDTVIAKAQSGYSDTTNLLLNSALRTGTTYRLVLLNNIGNDISGNKLKSRDTTSDTTSVISFTTIDSDSLAVSLSGGVSCLDRNIHRKWIFKPLGSSDFYLTQDNSGQFKFDSIPSGKGVLGYFEDLNENNKPDQGRVLPWISPEPYFMTQDTVEARARWEIEGVQVNICEPCKKQIEKTPVDTVGRKTQQKTKQ